MAGCEVCVCGSTLNVGHFIFTPAHEVGPGKKSIYFLGTEKKSFLFMGPGKKTLGLRGTTK